jgi:hypothetical protein
LVIKQAFYHPGLFLLEHGIFTITLEICRRDKAVVFFIDQNFQKLKELEVSLRARDRPNFKRAPYAFFPKSAFLPSFPIPSRVTRSILPSITLPSGFLNASHTRILNQPYRCQATLGVVSWSSSISSHDSTWIHCKQR